MSAFGGKADILVFLSAISLRQCRPMRWRVAKPPLGLCPRVHGRLEVAFDLKPARVVRRDAARLEPRGLMASAALSKVAA
jgi:hypothetical protein